MTRRADGVRRGTIKKPGRDAGVETNENTKDPRGALTTSLSRAHPVKPTAMQQRRDYWTRVLLGGRVAVHDVASHDIHGTTRRTVHNRQRLRGGVRNG